MKLSDGEKLIAMMLADLMKANEVKGEIDPDFVISAITGDHTWGLKWKYPGIFHNEAPADEVVEEVTSILTMSRMVEHSIEQLSPEDRAQIPEEDREVFVGFDGNNEDHFGVAVFLVEELGRYAELEGREMNSHMPMVPKYNRMRAAYDHVAGGMGPLSLQNIQTVLNA